MRKSECLVRVFCLLFCVTVHLSLFSQGKFLTFKENNKFGLKTTDEKILIPPQFEKIGWSTGINMPIDDVIGYYDDGWGLVNLKNRTVTAAKYYTLEGIHKDLIIASFLGSLSNELLFGAINAKGETIIGFKYHSVTRVKDLLIVSERRNGKSYYGLFSEQNIEVLPLEYNSIRSFNNNLFVFENIHGQKGIVHKNGSVLVEPKLDSIAPNQNGVSSVFTNGKVGLIDTLGRFIQPPKYKKVNVDSTYIPFPQIEIRTYQDKVLKLFNADSVSVVNSNTIAVHRNSFVELLDDNFSPITKQKEVKKISCFGENIIIESKNGTSVITSSGEQFATNPFDEVAYDEQYFYAKTNGLWQIYNIKGRKITTWKFKNIRINNNKLIPVQKNKYWGYINQFGEIAISFKYNDATPFIGNYAAVSYLGYEMFVDQFGQSIGEPTYDSVAVQASNIALAKTRGRIDLLDQWGVVLFQTYNKLENHSIGFLEKTEEGFVGLISRTGAVILEPIYDSISGIVNEKYVVVKSKNRTGLIEMNGSWIISLSKDYQDISSISEGLIGIKKQGNWGFLNFDSQLIIANRYDSVTAFRNGLAGVRLNGYWGYINKKEKLIIQPNFEEINDFKSNIAYVKRNKNFGVINLKGRLIIPTQYEEITKLNEKQILVKKQGKLGVFGIDGKQMVPTSYELLIPTYDNKFIVKRRNLYGIIDSKEKYLIPLRYKKILPYKTGSYLCLINN